MKKKLIISPLIAALIYTSCGIGENKNTENEQTTTINNTSIPNFNKSFEGTINGKYEIIMSLSKNKENLNGTYAYKSKGNLINITGTIDDNGNLTINEFNDKGNMTGVFIGQLSGNSISGKWTKPDGTKPMLFSISESINKLYTYELSLLFSNSNLFQLYHAYIFI